MLIRTRQGLQARSACPTERLFPRLLGCIRLGEDRSERSRNEIARRGYQMDPVFDAQYVPVRNSSLEQEAQIEVAYSADGWVDYIYVVDQLLARRDDAEQLRRILPGLRHVERDERHGLGDRRLPDGLAVLSIDRVEEGRFTVPEILDRLEENLGDDYLALHEGEPLVTPVHVMHTAKMCAAAEPGVPIGSPTQPSPPVQGN